MSFFFREAEEYGQNCMKDTPLPPPPTHFPAPPPCPSPDNLGFQSLRAKTLCMCFMLLEWRWGGGGGGCEMGGGVSGTCLKQMANFSGLWATWKIATKLSHCAGLHRAIQLYRMMWYLQIKQTVRKSCTHGTIPGRDPLDTPNSLLTFHIRGSISEAAFLYSAFCLCSFCTMCRDGQARSLPSASSLNQVSVMMLITKPWTQRPPSQGYCFIHYKTSYQQITQVNLSAASDKIAFLHFLTTLVVFV